MEILPSNRKSELITAGNDERSLAVRKKFGTPENLYIHATSGELSADTPSMVLCMMAYGEQTIRRQIAGRMKMAAMRMGETSIDLADTEIIAEAIASNEKARILGYDMVMRFFRMLELGEYELYACKPRNVMEAWQKYAKGAIAEQIRTKRKAESAKLDDEWRERQKYFVKGDELKALLERLRKEAGDADK